MPKYSDGWSNKALRNRKGGPHGWSHAGLKGAIYPYISIPGSGVLILHSNEILGFNYSNYFLLNNFHQEPNKNSNTLRHKLWGWHGDGGPDTGWDYCFSNYGILKSWLQRELCCFLFSNCMLQFQRLFTNGREAAQLLLKGLQEPPASWSCDPAK